MAPFDVLGSLGSVLGYGVFLLLGIAFGFVLEAAGFGDARRLAGQFYFKDLSVVRVMFTAIITAMLLIFGTAAVGLLDYEELWVNPTYLFADVVGGLIMGVGFIIGGYCPGTSLCSAATLKIDGIVFVAGVLFGVFVFGESVDLIRGWWFYGDFGRVTLFDLFGLPAGVVVLLAVALAFTFFGVMGALRRRLWGPEDPGTKTTGSPATAPPAEPQPEAAE